MHRPAFIFLLLSLLTFAVFSRTASADFVNYDDEDYVKANPHVQGGLHWANIVWAFTTGHASNWHPLTWLSHMLDCQLFGPHPGPMHLVNVAFHALNAGLLFLVLRRATGAHWRSAMVAALFALHPLHVESVAWISERKDVLSTLFLLLTLAAYLRYVEAVRSSAKSSRRLALYCLSLTLFALGLLSKPMLVTLPFLLLLLDYWPLARTFHNSTVRTHAHAVVQASEPALSPTSSRQGVGKHTDGRRLETCDTAGSEACTIGTPLLQRSVRLILEKLPFLLLAAASSVVTFVVQRKGGAVSTSLSLAGRLANAVVSYARYLGKTLWPFKLSVLYPHPGYWPAWSVIGSCALLAAIFAFVFWQRCRRPYLLVGWLWFFGGLIPVIGVVQVGIQSMADRYTYAPSIGLFLTIVWGVYEFLGKPSQPSAYSSRQWNAIACVSLLSVTACAVLTWHQLGFWQNSETLFTHAVQVTSKNYLAYNNLGYYLSNQGRSAEAMYFYSNSLAINPVYEDALNNVGYALAGQKKYSEAIAYYEKALRIRPDQVEVHNNLGNALSETGHMPEAIAQYEFVLKKNPEHADANNNLGIALAMQGKLNEAIVHFQAALRAKPDYASAHSNLGNAFAAQRKFDEATREYLESLRLNPRDAQAHNNLANVFSELGKLDEAIPHYREALRLNPDNPEAHFNLALALARRGQKPEAVAHLTEALRLKPDYTEARKQLEQLTSAPQGGR